MYEHYEVAVVGAGVVGISIAYNLACLGLERVLVLDRLGVGAGASGVQPGGVRQQWGTAAGCELARESYLFYRDAAAMLDSSLDLTFDECGYMFLAASDLELRAMSADVALQNSMGVPSRVLSPEEASRIVRDLDTSRISGATWCSEDGYFDHPQSVVAAFEQAAIAAGVRFEIAAVTALSGGSAGWTLRTSGGDNIGARRLVIAAGCDSALLLGQLDLPVPIHSEPRFLFLSHPIAGRLLDPLVVCSSYAFAAKQLADGRVLASYTAASGKREEQETSWRRTISERIEMFLPRLQYVTFPIVVEGEYDATPDYQPIVAEVADGLWLAAGFSGHGFMMAPAIGRRLADQIRHGRVDECIAEFGLARFSGTGIKGETEHVV